MTLHPPRQIPGVYHRKIGDIVVTAISDGYLDGTLDVMRNVDIEKGWVGDFDDKEPKPGRPTVGQPEFASRK